MIYYLFNSFFSYFQIVEIDMIFKKFDLLIALKQIELRQIMILFNQHCIYYLMMFFESPPIRVNPSLFSDKFYKLQGFIEYYNNEIYSINNTIKTYSPQEQFESIKKYKVGEELKQEMRIWFNRRRIEVNQIEVDRIINSLLNRNFKFIKISFLK